MRGKKAIQMSFAWLFAIIAGMAILFLAIYFSVRIVHSGQYQIDTETAKHLENLMAPLETSFETGKISTLSFPSETRIYNSCDNAGSFGTQSLRISQKSFGKWPEPSGRLSSRNNYLFSGDIEEGKKFYIFVKPFDYPFKIATLIFITSKEYCFLNPPPQIENELSQLGAENLKLNSCTDRSIRVCFGASSDSCDILVTGACNSYYCENEFDNGYVKKVKTGERVAYTGGLLYGAIFSDKTLYECQSMRLMQRLSKLSELYLEKSKFVSQQNCISGADSDLSLLQTLAQNFRSSEDFITIDRLLYDIRLNHEEALCRIW